MKSFILNLSVWAIVGAVAAFIASLFAVPLATAAVVGVAVLGARAVLVDASSRRRVSPVLAAIIVSAVAASVYAVAAGTSPWALVSVAMLMLLTRHWATDEIDATICDVQAGLDAVVDWVVCKVRSGRVVRMAEPVGV